MVALRARSRRDETILAYRLNSNTSSLPLSHLACSGQSQNNDLSKVYETICADALVKHIVYQDCQNMGKFPVIYSRPNAHATISGNSSRQNAPQCDPTRSFMTTSASATGVCEMRRAHSRTPLLLFLPELLIGQPNHYLRFPVCRVRIVLWAGEEGLET